MDLKPRDKDFAAFYEQARTGCLRAVYAAVGDWTRAEDATAEAFARAYARWSEVSGHPAPQAWVVRTALNAHVSWWRRRRREMVGHAVPDTADRSPAGPDLDQQVMAALRALPRRQREVVVLRIFLDLDTKTTAKTLGVSPGTVMTHLSRALVALRAALALTPDRSQ